MNPGQDIDEDWWRQFIKKEYEPIYFLLMAGGISDRKVYKEAIACVGKKEKEKTSIGVQLNREFGNLEKDGLFVNSNEGFLLTDKGKAILNDKERYDQMVNMLHKEHRSLLEKYLIKKNAPVPSLPKMVKEGNTQAKKKGSKKKGKGGIVVLDNCGSETFKKEINSRIDDDLLTRYRDSLEAILQDHSGTACTLLNENIACIFESLDDAVKFCLELIPKLSEINKQNKNQLENSSIMIRMGIHVVDPEDIDHVTCEEKEGEVHPALDRAKCLKDGCPIGKIALSIEAYNSLPLQKSYFRPSLLRSSGKDFYLSIDRIKTRYEEETFLENLMEKQRMAVPYIPRLDWDAIKPDDGNDLTTLKNFFQEPLTVILGESARDSSNIRHAATSDAVGLIEAMMKIEAKLDVEVGIDEWEDTADLTLDRNVLIVGSGAVNLYAYVLNDLFYPVKFRKEDGILDEVIKARSSNEREIKFSKNSPPRDSGLIIISKSPFNLKKSLLWIAGNTGMGTSAAANFMKDLIVDAESVLSNLKKAPKSGPPIACVVGAKTRQPGDDLSHYYKRLRILDYNIHWMVDRNGRIIFYSPS